MKLLRGWFIVHAECGNLDAFGDVERERVKDSRP